MAGDRSRYYVLLSYANGGISITDGNTVASTYLMFINDDDDADLLKSFPPSKTSLLLLNTNQSKLTSDKMSGT